MVIKHLLKDIIMMIKYLDEPKQCDNSVKQEHQQYRKKTSNHMLYFFGIIAIAILLSYSKGMLTLDLSQNVVVPSVSVIDNNDNVVHVPTNHELQQSPNLIIPQVIQPSVIQVVDNNLLKQYGIIDIYGRHIYSITDYAAAANGGYKLQKTYQLQVTGLWYKEDEVRQEVKYGGNVENVYIYYFNNGKYAAYIMDQQVNPYNDCNELNIYYREC